jgi:hypothetical protein
MKKINLIILCFLNLALIDSSFSQSLKQWEVTDSIQESLDINPLRFTNRAQCAVDSKKATQSVFVMLDSINTGKAFYRFSKITGGDTSVDTKMGIEKYRFTVMELIKLISKRLLNGDLPLLRTNIDHYKKTELHGYFESCNKGDCFDLNNYLQTLWKGEKSSIVSNGTIEARDYLKLNKDSVEFNDTKIGCYYIKKFSALQGHLYSTSPNKKTALTIAETVAKTDKYVSNCSEINKQENLKLANYQVDLLNISRADWKRHGFDFWNSLKIYLTWAFRYSEEAQQIAFPYHNLIKNVALEENILFISNGCKSVVAPKCDSQTLNLNSMRQFAQMNEQQLFRTDFSSQVAEGVENDVLNTPIVDVNEDILNFNRSHSADQWASNFRDKFTKTRGLLKLKFINAVNKLKAIKSHLPVEKMALELNNSGLQAKQKDALKSEIYYLCSEYKVASDKTMSFLNDEIDLLNNESVLDEYSKTLGGEDITTYISYFKDITGVVTTFCNKLAKENFWEDGFAIDREGFTAWYKEKTLNKKQPFKTNIIRKLSKEVKPILTYSFNDEENKKHNEIICVDGANCSRILLEGILDLYSSLRYADALLPTSTIQAPSLLNPYSERLACKMYDPFQKKRRVLYQFFYDIARAATFGLLPSPVYVSTEVVDKRVVSMKTLMDEGKISFDPKVDGYKFKHSLVADLGGLFGIPCAISISGASVNPVRYYRFNGVSVGTCSETRINNLVVNSSSDMSDYSYDRSKCVSCAINLETVIGGLASLEPITRSAYILARGAWNLFKGLRDPFDIPRRWTLNVNDTYDTYRKYGEVNKYCLKQLLKGKPCLANTCEGAVSRNINHFLKGGVEATFIPKKRGNGLVKLSSCELPIEVKLKYNRNRICKNMSQIKREDFIVPESCRIWK